MLIKDPRQEVALSGIVAALFFSFSFILISALYFPYNMPVIENLEQKSIFIWHNLVFAALPLAGGMSAVIFRKLLRPTSLDGEQVIDGSRLDIHIRFVRDTAHHLLLFIIMLINLAMFLEGDFLRLIPSVTSWFIFSRLYYWVAYLISPPHRIFGSTATLAPTVFFLCLSAINLLGWL